MHLNRIIEWNQVVVLGSAALRDVYAQVFLANIFPDFRDCDQNFVVICWYIKRPKYNCVIETVENS